MKVGIIGAGIVGACIGYALRKAGARVTLIDRGEPGRGCSFGNSGAISTSSVVPLALPGVVAQVPGMLLDPDSPLRLSLRYLPHAMPWLLAFLASARPARVTAAADRLCALHANAAQRHATLANEIGAPELILQRGHLHVYPDGASLAKDATAWRMREAYGFRFENLDRDGIVALEPRIGDRYQVGVFLADQATIVNPFRYVQAIVEAYRARGGEFLHDEVNALSASGDGGWQVRTSGACRRYTHLVVAAGAWSRKLLDPLDVHLPLESQRGYHVQYRGSAPISRTVVLADRKIFATPMEDGLRVGGTVEIAGLDAPPDPHREELLRRATKETFAGVDDSLATSWMGHRPCMPDSVPVIGPVAKRPGLFLAVGHGHLGLTDAPHTAEMITSMVMAHI
ncbi:MAG: FAD-dependent oxidoreductase [Casimicrobiaceae bacterium]